jgi:carbonic anhydrase
VNYVNGGQDWNTVVTTPVANANSLCGSGVAQSPINIVSSSTTYSSTLGALTLAYGASSSWELENTGARPLLLPLLGSLPAPRHRH